jgi:hypothetical protein
MRGTESPVVVVIIIIVVVTDLIEKYGDYPHHVMDRMDEQTCKGSNWGGC